MPPGVPGINGITGRRPLRIGRAATSCARSLRAGRRDASRSARHVWQVGPRPLRLPCRATPVYHENTGITAHDCGRVEAACEKVLPRFIRDMEAAASRLGRRLVQDDGVLVRFVSVLGVLHRSVSGSCPFLAVAVRFASFPETSSSSLFWFLSVLVVPIYFRFRFKPVPVPNVFFRFCFVSVRTVSVSVRFPCLHADTLKAKER